MADVVEQVKAVAKAVGDETKDDRSYVIYFASSASSFT